MKNYTILMFIITVGTWNENHNHLVLRYSVFVRILNLVVGPQVYKLGLFLLNKSFILAYCAHKTTNSIWIQRPSHALSVNLLTVEI